MAQAAQPKKVATDADETELWFKRWKAGEAAQKLWEEGYRVDDCYAYWKGHQRTDEFDGQKERKAQVNLIHPMVRSQLPQLYFYRPFARLTAAPERADTIGSNLEDRKQLLQDIGNYFARSPETGLRFSTFLALKESEWAMGVVEVGFSAILTDNPNAPRPPKKEDEDTKLAAEDVAADQANAVGDDDADSPFPPEAPPVAVPPPAMPVPAAVPAAGLGEVDDLGLPVTPPPDAGPGLAPVNRPPRPAPEETVDQEIARRLGMLQGETFYVKFIAEKQVVISESDKPVLAENDWYGYWEDYDIEDVKRVGKLAGWNIRGLKPSTGKKPDEDAEAEKLKSDPDGVEAKKIRLYKIWDLRTHTKLILADGHKKILKKYPFKRLGGLKFLRQDIDPYHFRPVPPIYNSLGEQDVHNDAWEYLRKTEKQTKARWTYDKQAVKADDIEKFEKDDANYIPRDAGTTRPIEPIEHPQFTQLPLQLLGLSERAFAQTSGTSAEARQAQNTGEKTATQAVIQNTSMQVVGSFDRQTVADWLAEVIEELIHLAVDHMNLPRVLQMNVDRESQFALFEAAKVAALWKQIKAEDLMAAADGITWHVTVDIESISPVAEQEQLQRLMNMLNFVGNEKQAIILSRAPIILDRLLDLSGMRGGRDRDVIRAALQAVEEFARMSAQSGAGLPGGIAPMAGGPSPNPAIPAQPVGPPGGAPQPPGPPGVRQLTGG